ncbi:MAG: hypothetical protein QOG89_2982, partial [Thermomicrobiales bacterium]|nr:hypothetical protein [Thermomicrobiales bacterium]
MTEAPAAGGKADAAKVAPQPLPEDMGPQPNEKPDQWLARQARYAVRFGSEYVAKADADGYDGVKMTVYHTAGPAVYIAAIEKVGDKPKPRPAGTAPKSASTIAAELGPDIEQLLVGNPRQIHVTFGRDERGIMQDRGYRAEALPPTPKPPVRYAPDTRSERERLKDYGILDPKKHWKESFEKTEETVKEVAIKGVTFLVTEIATSLVAGGILKVLGAGLSRLPRLYRLIRGKKTKDLAEGLAKLSRTEADEFARLVERANRGEKLGADEIRRLEELAKKLDDALVPGARTGQQATSTGGGGSTRTTGTGTTSTADDAAKGAVGSQATTLIKANINYNKPLATSGWRSSLQGEGFGVFEGRIPG